MRGYPKYQETGLDWLGKVPAHWSLGKLGTCFSERNEKVSDTEYPALSVTKNGIVPQMEHVAKTDAGDNRKKVCKNDFVINSRSDRKGSAGVSDYEGSVSLISTVLEPRFYLPEFAHHLFRSYNFQEEFYRFGKGIVADLWSTRYAEMKNIVVPIVPHEEQKAIASFLDQETARIDSLIDEKQTFINLLKEKRQALISHVVTKGLDPNVKMKDSGVEWIGEVPEHWTVMSLGKITLSKCDGPFGSGLKSSHYTSAGVRVVRLQNIKMGYFMQGKDAFIDAEYYEKNLRNHDVFERDLLIAGLGDPKNPVGRACVAPAGIEPAMVKADCFRFRLNDRKVIPNFVAYQLSSGANFDAATLATGATRARIPLMTMAARKVVICPREEQQRILRFLHEALPSYESLIAETEKSIILLQEHRVSLISAAVTGKIDVRNHREKAA